MAMNKMERLGKYARQMSQIENWYRRGKCLEIIENGKGCATQSVKAETSKDHDEDEDDVLKQIFRKKHSKNVLIIKIIIICGQLRMSVLNMVKQIPANFETISR